MKLLYLDTETTGFDPQKNGLIQISGIIEIDGVVKEKFDLKCKPFPGQRVTQGALKINNMTIEQIRSFPQAASVYKKLERIFDCYIDRYNKADKFYLIGQNVKFDYDFHDAWFRNNGNTFLNAHIFYGKVDLLAVTTVFKMAGKINPENARLETLAKFFGVELTAHDALSDITATREIFLRFISMAKTCEPCQG